MAKYKLLVSGFGMEGTAHTITPEEVQKIKKFQEENGYDELYQMYSDFPEILDDFEFGLPNWWVASRPYVNDRLRFTLWDEEENEVWSVEWRELGDLYELDEKYSLPEDFEESTEVLDAYPHEGKENILCIIEDVKGTLNNYKIESDDAPEPKDFAFSSQSIESPIFDYEIVDKMFYKNHQLEKDYDDEWVMGKSLDVYVFTLDDLKNGVYDED